jgi:hypothetical protein
MSIHRLPKKSLALVLVAGAVVVGTQVDGNLPGVATGAHATSIEGRQNAAPPVLPRATPAELAVIRQAEAQEAAASAYDPSPSQRYSLAGLNGYGSTGK